uniref:Receptor protein kinase CLAVATA1 n=1 Tax=Rhizophora mucronata TaxID=61149 RepID=A0A2P2IQG3_RHIMU
MQLLENDIEVREERRQRKVGKGPESCELERSTELTRPVTGSQETPCQLHGVSSRSFHVERAPSGSERPSFTRWRKRPSWFSERVVAARERTRSETNTEIIVLDREGT